MRKLPDDRTLAELLEMGKSLEAQSRKVYLMAEAFAQKYEQRLKEAQLPTTQKGDH